jgi:hypothetical protein
MSLQVGVDSYVTVEEADEFISKTYISTDAYRAKWSTLSTEDKEALLRASTLAIDQLAFTGTKRDWGQKLSFPRVTMTSFIGTRYGSDGLRPANQFYDTGIWDTDVWTDGGMGAAKRATAENALAASYLQTEVQSTTVNGIKGLKSKSVGPISESYDLTNSETTYAKRGIYSQKVYTYLNCWLADSFMNA